MRRDLTMKKRNDGVDPRVGVEAKKCVRCGRMTIVSINKESDILCSRKGCN